MKAQREFQILNPVGDAASAEPGSRASKGKARAKPIVGLINNSKPNVGYFLEAIDARVRERGLCTLNVVKPRSAGPLPDLVRFARNCDFVINAVAD